MDETTDSEVQSYAATLRLIAANITGEDADRPVAKAIECAADQLDALKKVLLIALPGLRDLVAQNRPDFAERDRQVLAIVINASSLDE